MKEKLEQQLLHTVIIPAGEVVWVKYKKEISIEGKMFDVKSTVISNGQYVFTGLFDNEETALNNFFETETNQKNRKGNQLLTQLFQLLQSIYTANHSESAINTGNKEIYFVLTFSNIISPFINILTPPPQA